LTTRRDFTFVSDTADGFLSALRAPLELVLGQTINLGSGFDVRIEKLVELVGEILNRKLEINVDDERVRPDKSEVDRLLACNKKAEELLDWTPVFQGEDGLKRGLEETISWFEKQLGDEEVPADRYTI
jgi:nucleoside-diphosphate-sugar epimerase